jgi:hypothetical protein
LKIYGAWRPGRSPVGPLPLSVEQKQRALNDPLPDLFTMVRLTGHTHARASVDKLPLCARCSPTLSCMFLIISPPIVPVRTASAESHPEKAVRLRGAIIP